VTKFLEERAREIEFQRLEEDFKKKLILLSKLFRDPETDLLSSSLLESCDTRGTRFWEFRLRLALRPEVATLGDSTKREEGEENLVK